MAFLVSGMSSKSPIKSQPSQRRSPKFYICRKQRVEDDFTYLYTYLKGIIHKSSWAGKSCRLRLRSPSWYSHCRKCLPETCQSCPLDMTLSYQHKHIVFIHKANYMVELQGKQVANIHAEGGHWVIFLWSCFFYDTSIWYWFSFTQHFMYRGLFFWL